MAIETFTWCPKVDPVGTVSFRTRSAKFGDGYEQVAGRDQQSLTVLATDVHWVRCQDQTDHGLYRRPGRHQSVYWSPPLGEQGLYRCSSYQSSALGAGMYSLVATFEQAFHP
ncbi:phage tail protein [Pseudomonas protegens]|uniref:phage tail protein n=1 Tax=Pseudomonas protegens TaxID=380021 RepID=UPI001C8DBFFF|nr:phage tail protein [Pseudomonas protegens]QZI72926.1 phage tail protein [Pseudomonas protegens]